MPLREKQASLHGFRAHYLHHEPDNVATELTARRRKRRRWAPAAAPENDPVVLIHGIAGSCESWRPVMTELARRRFPREVIAPDLMGHGDSAKPDVDYSLGMFAGWVRDLLATLGHQRATVVGHSLGGAVAMQVSYQFPELCGRLALVSSTGLGRDIWPLTRAANLPGAEVGLSLLANPATLAVGATLAGLRGWSAEDRELAQCFASLADPAKRAAYLSAARSSTTLSGQRTPGVNRLHLAEFAPSLIVWGAKDRVIPVKHARRAASLMPHSRLEIIAGRGHFPHVAEPARFGDILTGFLDVTTPARWNSADLAPYLRARSAGATG
jgi:pimeloyl-ACP methyl ester carboxylesterase